MKPAILVVSLLLLATAQSSRVRREDMYPSKYDQINEQQIISNERILKNFIDCLLDRGSCTPDGKLIKDILPEALETECAKCSKIQRDKVKKVAAFLKNNKPNYYTSILDKFDPDRKYIQKYGEMLQNF